MDGKFRLVFAETGKTPSANAYLSDEAQVFDRLHDAVKLGHERNIEFEVPFISHRFLVLDPVAIGMLYREFVAAS